MAVEVAKPQLHSNPAYFDPPNMAYLDPQSMSFALQFQLQEIEAERSLRSGKWPEDSPPDYTLAFDAFEAELKTALAVVQDLKIAHSIATAIDSDAVVLQELRADEEQSAQDRELALSLNDEDEDVPSQAVLEWQETFGSGADLVGWDHSEASTLSIESGTVAGSSMLRQKSVFESQSKLLCSVCGDNVHPHSTVRLRCGDVYCKPCLKAFFLRVIKDETLFPPRCHREPIDVSTIEAEFSAEESIAYRKAVLEFTSTDRVYCADHECGQFIPMSQRTHDYASCEACSADTCLHCKALAHDGGCAADEARQSLIQFADEQGWKACFGCGEMVFRYEGCNHMT